MLLQRYDANARWH